MKLNKNCGFCDSQILRYPCKTNTYFCNKKCKANWQIQQRENLGFTKEWLLHQYFTLGKDCTEIGKEIGRDSKSVWNWFKVYNIKIQKRGQSIKQQFKKGHKQGVGRIHTSQTKEKIRQARIADGHVPYLKDGIHWLKHPGMVSPMWKGGITPDRQAVYCSPEWVDAVKLIWKRDNATCQLCKHHQSDYRGTKFHIHHIKSFMVVNLRCDPDNLVLLCPSCHKFVHSKSNIKKLFIA